ncbi:unnamed protein product, partial [Mesorhabditis belari]|uniref:Uncharacterized protein n=1 Tax=Mesorhabditis belari TaxID=2138241 RepID=A0AAF3EBY6_9BILA
MLHFVSFSQYEFSIVGTRPRRLLFLNHAEVVDGLERLLFCFETCPADHDFIRESSGRCESDTNKWCIPDASFGQPCSVFFGLGMTKKFCCKSDPVDCTWSGRWMEANNGYNIYCRYDSSVGRCGQLHCSINHRDRKAVNTSLIEGERCDELSMWESEGKATCGLIQWTRNETVLNTWYKTQ